ncbi:MAG: proteasome-associated ATPase, partial [Nocardioidaceae bacterium]|nr:proteasome-associated ATPase [Nocardioidaceae bacterium]
MTDNEPIRTSGQSGSEQELGYLRAEVEHLRRRLGSEGSTDSRLADIEAKLAATSSQNERLTSTLREARDQIVTLKEEVDRLAQPPTGFGTFLQRNDDDTIDVFTGGRKLRVNVSPAVDKDTLRKGQEVILNEAMNVVMALDFEQTGEVVSLKEIL